MMVRPEVLQQALTSFFGVPLQTLAKTTTQRDRAGRPMWVADGDGNVTAFAYDGAGRLVAESDALGTRRFAYARSDDVLVEVAPDGSVREYGYDAFGRRLSERWLDEANRDVRVMGYLHDQHGRLRHAGDLEASYDYTSYDRLGRLTALLVSGPGLPDVQMSWAYAGPDGLGQSSATRTLRLGGAVDSTEQRTADALGRLAWVSQTGGGATLLAGFSHRPSGQLLQVGRFQGGTLVGATGYEYDGIGQLTGIEHSQGGGGLTIGLGRDRFGRIASYTGPEGTTRYGYDALGQLTWADAPGSEADEGYGYTLAGNRTGVETAQPNLLTSDGRRVFAYDGNGNRSAEMDLGTGRVTQYGWDHRGRLVGVSVSEHDEEPVAEVSYGYDVFDRRVLREVSQGAAEGDPGTQRYVHDGEHVALALGAQGQVQERYLYGAATDQVLAVTLGSGLVLWALSDHLGSVRAWADGAGQAAKALRYGAFGQLVEDSAPELFLQASYTGREYEPLLGLYYYRARWYDPQSGKFLSQDPLRLGAGDTNFSRYVGNSPTHLTDPSGHAAFIPFLLGALAVGTLGGGAIGAIAGGLSGQGEWDWDRALAGFISGATAGAGIGLMVGTWGLATPLSTAMVGAGISAGIGSAAGGGLFTSGSVNWAGFGKGWAIGAFSGFMGGYTAAVLAPVFSGTGVVGGGVGGALTGFSAGVVGDLLGQSLAIGLGWQGGYNRHQLLASGVFGGLVGGVAGMISGGLAGLRAGRESIGKGGLSLTEAEINAVEPFRVFRGVAIREVNGIFVKTVDTNARWYWRLIGQASIEAQALGLRRLGEAAVDFSYRNGVLLTANAGKEGIHPFWGLFFRTAWRLGRVPDLTSKRNVSNTGVIFDPVYPVHLELFKWSPMTWLGFPVVTVAGYRLWKR